MAKVIENRAKGLTFREIGRLMNKDVRQIYRWYQYGVDFIHKEIVDNKK